MAEIFVGMWWLWALVAAICFLAIISLGNIYRSPDGRVTGCILTSVALLFTLLATIAFTIMFIKDLLLSK